jgi:hypothetical protein
MHQLQEGVESIRDGGAEKEIEAEVEDLRFQAVDAEKREGVMVLFICWVGLLNRPNGRGPLVVR